MSDSILLIENNPAHAQQIAEALSTATVRVVHSPAGAAAELYNFRALNPDSHVVVVDLDLGNSKEVNPNQGLDLIRHDLWPYDRTTFFVVFSAYVPRDKLALPRSAEPHWTFVEKELRRSPDDDLNLEGKLSDLCLRKLKDRVGKCLLHSRARLAVPQFDTREYLDIVRDYEASSSDRSLSARERSLIEDSIWRSTRILSRLAQGADAFNLVGRPVEAVAVGVYGSVGRMEARGSSDVEFSVFYDGKRTPDVRLVASLWSRTARMVRDAGLKHEGMSATVDGLLPYKHVGDETPHNGYLHTMDVSVIPTLDVARRPEFRNRHFQLLTELQPVFNAELLLSLRLEIVRKRMGPVKTLQSFALHEYFGDISRQFLMDTRSSRASDLPNLKRRCMRTLNVLAMRVWLAVLVRYQVKQDLREREEWGALFHDISMPGVVKLMDSVARLAPTGQPLDAGIARIVDELDRAVKHYVSALGLLSAYSQPLDGEDEEPTDIPGAPETRSTVLHIDSALSLMKQHKFFAPSANTWLFEQIAVQL